MVCPPILKIGIGMTDSGPSLDSDWSDSVQEFLLDRAWTDPGQALDSDWILRPLTVQTAIQFQYQKLIDGYSIHLLVTPLSCWSQKTSKQTDRQTKQSSAISILPNMKGRVDRKKKGSAISSCIRCYQK